MSRIRYTNVRPSNQNAHIEKYTEKKIEVGQTWIVWIETNTKF